MKITIENDRDEDTAGFPISATVELPDETEAIRMLEAFASLMIAMSYTPDTVRKAFKEIGNEDSWLAPESNKQH